MLDYLVVIGTLVAINAISVVGMNIQFGYAGLVNLMTITFVAVGGYVTMVLCLPPASYSPYILGLQQPFAVGVAGGMVVSGVLGLIVGAIALSRIRAFYFAIVTFCVAEIAYQVVSADKPLFGGSDGVVGLPSPYIDLVGVANYGYFYFGLCLAALAIVFIFAEYLRRRPFGRVLRAVRDDRDAARAFGRNVFRLQLKAFVIGCVIAGLAGGLLVGFTGALSPGSWSSAETTLFLTAMFLGGSGNNWGVVLGILLVGGVLNEGTRLILPGIMTGGQQAAFQQMIIGAVLIVILRWRPRGLMPEQVRRDSAVASQTANAA